MNNQYIMNAAETLMSMCCDFRMGGITQSTFVSNLEIFANECRAQLVEGQKPSTNSRYAAALEVWDEYKHHSSIHRNTSYFEFLNTRLNAETGTAHS